MSKEARHRAFTVVPKLARASGAGAAVILFGCQWLRMTLPGSRKAAVTNWLPSSGKTVTSRHRTAEPFDAYCRGRPESDGAQVHRPAAYGARPSRLSVRRRR